MHSSLPHFCAAGTKCSVLWVSVTALDACTSHSLSFRENVKRSLPYNVLWLQWSCLHCDTRDLIRRGAPVTIVIRWESLPWYCFALLIALWFIVCLGLALEVQWWPMNDACRGKRRRLRGWMSVCGLSPPLLRWTGSCEFNPANTRVIDAL